MPMKALILILATLSVCVQSQAVGLYKWTDENGVVHYGANKPHNINAQQLSTKSMKPINDPGNRTQGDLDDLVGKWKGSNGDIQMEVTINDDDTWSATVNDPRTKEGSVTGRIVRGSERAKSRLAIYTMSATTSSGKVVSHKLRKSLDIDSVTPKMITASADGIETILERSR